MLDAIRIYLTPSLNSIQYISMGFLLIFLVEHLIYFHGVDMELL